MAEKGAWARIRVTVLEPEQRALSSLPEDTQKLPLTMWVKGTLTGAADLEKPAQVVTATGRLVQGVLEEVNPCYTHSFGAYVPELEQAGRDAVEFLFGEES